MLDAARALLPDAPIVYAADFAGLPYGEKSEAEIAARACLRCLGDWSSGTGPG